MGRIAVEAPFFGAFNSPDHDLSLQPRSFLGLKWIEALRYRHVELATNFGEGDVRLWKPFGMVRKGTGHKSA